MNTRTIIIGYGNPYRRDDGVAFHILNALRARLGRHPLAMDDDGQDELGQPVDTMMLHQLLPELAPVVAEYQKAIFVDAHAGVIPEGVRIIAVEEQFGFQAVTHHMSPGMLLSLARQTGGRTPEGWLVSVRGEDFDFGDQISPPCQVHANEAVDKIFELVHGGKF